MIIQSRELEKRPYLSAFIIPVPENTDSALIIFPAKHEVSAAASSEKLQNVSRPALIQHFSGRTDIENADKINDTWPGLYGGLLKFTF